MAASLSPATDNRSRGGVRGACRESWSVAAAKSWPYHRPHCVWPSWTWGSPGSGLPSGLIPVLKSLFWSWT